MSSVSHTPPSQVAVADEGLCTASALQVSRRRVGGKEELFPESIGWFLKCLVAGSYWSYVSRQNPK